MNLKRHLPVILLLILAFSISVATRGQTIRLKQSEESGIYKRGQNIFVTASGFDRPGDSVKVRIIRNNDQVVGRKSIPVSSDTLELYSGSFDNPCSIIVEARYKDQVTSLGMIVEPEKIKPGAACPSDFNSYWKKLKKELRAIPMDIKSTPVANNDIDKGFICTDIEINCPGTRPARGYLVRPENPAPRSMPIVLLVHAAGVKGSWCRSEPKNAMVYGRMGALCFDLNAHGMLNGQPDSYYADLEKGELKGYWLQGITNRDEVYFKGMYLRLIRTLDFLTDLPEWDGKRILVIGESQGGGQALAAAGFDRRVDAVVAIVPAMCDWFGSMAGRIGGWPQPFLSENSKEEMKKALPYFDAANILKRSRATIFTEIGLIDMTCASTSVYAAVNQAKGRKIIYTVPYRPHHQPQNDLGRLWEETVYKPREQFISNYLK
jgi:cephalosporin-C deacetylase-like acetyl esterase